MKSVPEWAGRLGGGRAQSVTLLWSRAVRTLSWVRRSSTSTSRRSAAPRVRWQIRPDTVYAVKTTARREARRGRWKIRAILLALDHGRRMDAPTRHVLSDKAWLEVAKAIDQVRSRRGRPGYDDRRFFEAACWILRTGAPWRDLPAMFGRWEATYRRFTRSRRGNRARIHHQLRNRLGIAGAVGAMGSTSIRVHQHGAPPCSRRENEAVGISRGGKTTKLHVLASRGRRGSLWSWAGRLTPGHTTGSRRTSPVLCP